MELVVEASNPAGFPASAVGGFGLGVYSLLLLSEEGHVLLYRQISQPESVSFGGRAALRRMRAILLHNQWIGVDSSVDLNVDQSTIIAGTTDCALEMLRFTTLWIVCSRKQRKRGEGNDCEGSIGRKCRCLAAW